MTEKELISLGFEKQIAEFPDSDENPFYYYTLDIIEGLYGITDSNDEIKNDEWTVELNFDCNPIVKFKDVKSITELTNLFKPKQR